MGKIIGEGITFDDVLLVPAYSKIIPADVELRTKLTRGIDLNMVHNINSLSREIYKHKLSIDECEKILNK